MPGCVTRPLLWQRGARDWDLVIPTYAGDLTKPSAHEKLSYIAVQVKYRESGSPTMVRGQLLPRDDSAVGLGSEAILLWLEMGRSSAASQPLRVQHSRKSSARVLSKVCEPPATTGHHWELQTSSFAFADIFGGDTDAFPRGEGQRQGKEGRSQRQGKGSRSQRPGC